MGRYASDGGGGGDFRPAPAGTHMARCVRLIDLGTRANTYPGSEGKKQNRVYIGWELPDELDSFGDKMLPFVVGRFFTNTLSEMGALRPILESWRGKPFTTEELMRFDLQNVIGQPCMLSVVHETKDGKTKAKVVSAAKLMKNQNCPPQVNPSQVFWLDEFKLEVFEQLPEGFQKIIKESDEYKARMLPVREKYEQLKPQPDPDEDIPF